MKIIDLLNRIANDEEVRFRIGEECEIYHWNKGEYLVLEATGNEEQWYIDDKWLNKEVEIIEEDKKIEKLQWCKIKGDSTKAQLLELRENIILQYNKINEIIDKINED